MYSSATYVLFKQYMRVVIHLSEIFGGFLQKANHEIKKYVEYIALVSLLSTHMAVED